MSLWNIIFFCWVLKIDLCHLIHFHISECFHVNWKIEQQVQSVGERVSKELMLTFDLVFVFNEEMIRTKISALLAAERLKEPSGNGSSSFRIIYAHRSVWTWRLFLYPPTKYVWVAPVCQHGAVVVAIQRQSLCFYIKVRLAAARGAITAPKEP